MLSNPQMTAPTIAVSTNAIAIAESTHATELKDSKGKKRLASAVPGPSKRSKPNSATNVNTVTTSTLAAPAPTTTTATPEIDAGEPAVRSRSGHVLKKSKDMMDSEASQADWVRGCKKK